MEGSPCDQEEAAKDPAAKQRPLGETLLYSGLAGQITITTILFLQTTNWATMRFPATVMSTLDFISRVRRGMGVIPIITTVATKDTPTRTNISRSLKKICGQVRELWMLIFYLTSIWLSYEICVFGLVSAKLSVHPPLNFMFWRFWLLLFTETLFQWLKTAFLTLLVNTK